MSWLYSQALVAAFSEENSWDGEPCAQLNVMPTQHKFWRKDKTMDVLSLSRFGLTCAVLTESRGAELLTWFLADSRARTSAQPERAQGSTANAAGCGQSLLGSFGRYDHDSRGWKTHQHSLLGGLDEFSETWPRWGLMRNGECWEREMWEVHTNGTESGFSHPTPTTRDWKGASNGQRLDYSRWTSWLHHAVSHNHYTTYPNPSCSEAVMGWPTGWTELEPLEIDKFQEWQRLHSVF
jgi:hypothetical protein